MPGHDRGCKPLLRRYNTRMERPNRRRCLGLAAIGMALATGSLMLPVPSEPGRAEEPVVQTAAQEISREAVWRAIFARPHEQPSFDPVKAALGRDLFTDVRLSGAGHASCASCHDPDRAFTDGRKTAVGPGGAVLARNAPALYNLAWATSFFWDGRAASLADQAKFPILAPDELAGNFQVIASRLADDPAMRERFEAAFPGAAGVSETSILDALAAYEQSLVSPQTRFDQWVDGDEAALTGEEARGFDIFVGKGGCVSCHGGWRLTDDAFHDIGISGKDLGRGSLASGAAGLPEFKTPSLREVARTAPYMHDGSLARLEDVVDHYSDGLLVRPSLAPTVVRDLKLTKDEKAALVAFLKTLSSEQKSHTPDETTRPMLKK